MAVNIILLITGLVKYWISSSILKRMIQNLRRMKRKIVAIKGVWHYVIVVLLFFIINGRSLVCRLIIVCCK